jgi:succinylglutamate desuccinylase
MTNPIQYQSQMSQAAPAVSVPESNGEALAATFDLSAVPRELGRVEAAEPGPTLICLGGLHGNEPAGVLAIDRVLKQIFQRSEGLRGRLIGLTGNITALAAGRRFVRHDLNRIWRPSRVEQLSALAGPLNDEDQELVELNASLSRILDEAPGRVYLLDLHTISGPGPAFAILDDTLQNREVALDFPVPLVLGLEEKLGGTLASYMTAQGVTVVGFEAGMHDDPTSVDRAASAIWIALDSCGVFEHETRSEVVEARDLLRRQSHCPARIVEVRYRHNVAEGESFEMVPGFASFDPIAAGQEVGTVRGGKVRAPRSGLMLMPLYQDQGNDGFFLVNEVRPAWLPVSAVVRRLGLERFLHLLPGVERDPNRRQTFIVDRRYALWFARQLFHLLGFRQEGKDGPRLTMTRRRDQLL